MPITNEYTPDKKEWSRVGVHKWKNINGYVIQRMWTITGNKKHFFLCYKTEDDYDKGNNFASFNHLKEAKTSFEKLNKEE